MNTTTTMNFLTKSSMAKRIWMVGCWLLIALATTTYGQSNATLFPPKPEPAVYVHDYAGWLSEGQKATLEQKLRRYQDSTSTQIVVMIRPDIGDYDKASYAFELGNRWGIGRKDKNNGVLMLIKSEPPERGVFIATGYGTEGALPDITAGRIIRNTIAPYFRQQQYYEGIDAGVNDIIRALAGEFKADGKEAGEGSAWVVLLVLFFIFLLIFFFLRRAIKKGTLYDHSGRPMSRNTGGGGWWIGGGGGSWGGGSSNDGGGWGDGGSFGGGSFGGGGAGGDW